MALHEIGLVIADIGFPAVFCLLLWRYIERHGDRELTALNAICMRLGVIEEKLDRHLALK